MSNYFPQHCLVNILTLNIFLFLKPNITKLLHYFINKVRRFNWASETKGNVDSFHEESVQNCEKVGE